MAFKTEKSILVYGETLTFKNAYHRIELLERKNNDISVLVVSYSDQTKKHCIGSKQIYFKLNPGTENTLENAYNEVKKDSEFPNAIDI